MIMYQPPHRPAMPSTSNISPRGQHHHRFANNLYQQQQSSSSSSSTMTTTTMNHQLLYNGGVGQSTASDILRVGHRHLDKLEQIRASLKPFEAVATTSTPVSTFDNGGAMAIPLLDELQNAMLLKLCHIGFEKDMAYLALKLVKFSSVAAAMDVLLNVKKDHVFHQEFAPPPPPTRPAPTSSMMMMNNGGGGGGHYGYQLKLNNTVPTSNADEHSNSSSRSDSPSAVHGRIPSPPSVIGFRSPSPIMMMIRPPPPHQHYFGSSSTITTSPLSTIPSPPGSSRGSLASGTDRSFTPILPSSSQLLTSSSTQLLPSSSIKQSHAHVAMRPAPAMVDYSVRQNAGPPLLAASSRKVRLPAPQSATTIINIQQRHPSSIQHRQQTSVIRARLDRTTAAPSLVRIAVESTCDSANRRHNNYRLESANELSSTGINHHRILVDPDAPTTSLSYVDQLRYQHHDSSEPTPMVSSPARTFQQIIGSNPMGGRSNSPSSLSISTSSSAESATATDQHHVHRCVSPLPESIAERIASADGRFESSIKPCKPRMFCFFMEQHVGRLMQQYKERKERWKQLSKEMESAGLPAPMREQMHRFLMQKESRYTRLRRQKMSKAMFERIRVIGVGAFGEVALVRKRDTGQLYAMKTLMKRDVIAKKQAAHVKAERDILAEANSDWIVKLFYSFQDEHSLFFILEYIAGGDMMTLLCKKQIFDEPLARFYIAELACAIESVHSLGFIHRDIKPDNILIDQHGHIKLTDFGLCTGLRWTHDKKYYNTNEPCSSTSAHIRDDSFDLLRQNVDQIKVLDYRNGLKRNQAHSLVGTSNYMAPEVLNGDGHSQLCDWWSVGVILYEMVIGIPPFYAETPQETQWKIVNWKSNLNLNISDQFALSRDVVDMIAQLCRDQSDRLGCCNGAHDVKSHPWFRGIDFVNLRKSRAPYRPTIEHAEDTSNFDAIESVLSFDNNNPVASHPLSTTPTAPPSATNPAFYEFTFRHFFDFDPQGCPTLRLPAQQHRSRPSLAPLIDSAASMAAVAASADDDDDNSGDESMIV